MFEISNKEVLHEWMRERRELGRSISSIKGPPLDGDTYSDGTPIDKPINVAWQDDVTGEIVAIEYGIAV